MSLSGGDVAQLVQILRSAGRSEIMPRFRKLDAGDIRAKSGPLDLVTVADEAAERHVTQALRNLYPDALVVGEEAVSADPSLLDGIEAAGLAFVIDPIDGTSNFAAGVPLFGCMLAVLRRGETIAGLIHDPVGDDTVLALRGEGAWLETPGGRRVALRAASAVPPERMVGNASWRYMATPRRETVLANLAGVMTSWDYRCAAYEYRLIAGGHSHFLMFNRTMPWDHLAGVLVHREAGGFSARLDGSAYRASSLEGGLLCAPDEASWRSIRDMLLRGRGS